ncbi:MAG: hypothetical protein ACXV4Z_09370 [Halobacteriota archaeon]
MVAREPAWRVFAHEFNQSTLQYKEGEERGPTYVISPTGAKINRMFVVGVLTEVEDVRSSHDLWRARIADPTGSFTVYAGQYQEDAAAFLAQAETPQFVTVLGRGRLYTRNETTYASIWSEEVTSTSERVRNNWVINTAERTLDRLDALKIAVSSGTREEALRETLRAHNIHPVLIEGVVRAAAYYEVVDVIADMLPTIAAALDMLGESRGFAPAAETVRPRHEARKAAGEEGRTQERQETTETEETSDELAASKERVIEMMRTLDNGSGVPYDTLIESLGARGLEEEDVEEAVQELMDDGKCYEPKIGILKLI